MNTGETIGYGYIYAGPCWQCGCGIVLPEALYRAARHSDAISIYCGYGHPGVFKKRETETDRIRRERDRLKQDIARVEDEAREARQRAEAAQERATKAEAKAKRLTKRAAAGTCPCCKRTFSELAQHMKHQHPEFVTDTGAKVVSIKSRTKAA